MLDGSYFISDIHDYFEYIIKSYKTITNNPPTQIFFHRIKNRVIFKIKKGCRLDFQSQEKMKMLGSTDKEIDKDKKSEHVPKLEIVEVVLMLCNVINNDYQQASRVLSSFVPIKNSDD